MHPSPPALAGARDRWARWAPWGLAAVALVAAALRLREAMGAKLWFDEIYVVLVSRMSAADIARMTATDIHPPLAYLMRHAWQRLGGENELWLKSLSIGLAVAGVVATYAVGRRMRSPRMGLIAAAILAISVPHIHYSQEVESYSLVWLAIVLMVGHGWGWVTTRGTRDAVAFVAWSAIGMWSHYLMIPFVAVVALWGMLALRRDGAALGRWVALLALIGLLFAPQMPTLIAQFHREGNGSFFRFPTAAGLLDLARTISFGSYAMMAMFAAFALFALRDRAHRSTTLLLCMTVALPLLATRLYAFILSRDMLAAMPFAYLLVADGLDQLPGPLVTDLLVIGTLALGLRAWVRHEPFVEPRSLARIEQTLHEHAGPHDLVVHAETHSLLYFHYYDPAGNHRLLVSAGALVPYFDAGLVIPDSLDITLEQLEAQRDAGTRWWGVRVDRAFVTRGVATRAGARGAAEFDSLAHQRVWRFPRVELWEGTAGASPAR